MTRSREPIDKPGIRDADLRALVESGAHYLQICASLGCSLADLEAAADRLGLLLLCPSATGYRWTPARKETFRRLLSQGLSYRACSETLGMTARTAKKLARRFGFDGNEPERLANKQFWTPRRTSILVAEYEKRTNIELSKLLGVSRGAVTKQAARMGLGKANVADKGGSRYPVSNALRERIGELYLQGLPIHQIGIEVGRNENSVSWVLRGLQVARVRKHEWLPDEDQQLLSRRAAGATWNQIASDLGRTVHSVNCRWRLLRTKAVPRTGRAEGLTESPSARRT